MPNIVQRKLVLITIFTNVFQQADVQMAMPMYMPAVAPQPLFAMPAPIAVAVRLARPVTTTTTTTTTTPAPNIVLAMPVPVPLPVQLAVPAVPAPTFCQRQPRPRACPPCPPCVCMPSCTPAFFSYCSSCHLKCRCRNPEDAPVPIHPNPPAPIPGPAYPIPVPLAPVSLVEPSPVVVLPLPQWRQLPMPLPPRPRRKQRRKHYFQPFLTTSSSDETSGCDDTSLSSDSVERKYRGGIKFKRRRTRIYKRNAVVTSEQESAKNDFSKAIRCYVSDNDKVQFDIKFDTKEGSEGKAKTSDSEQRVHTENNKNAIIVSDDGRKSVRKYDQILLRDGV